MIGSLKSSAWTRRPCESGSFLPHEATFIALNRQSTGVDVHMIGARRSSRESRCSLRLRFGQNSSVTCSVYSCDDLRRRAACVASVSRLRIPFQLFQSEDCGCD